MEGDLVLALSGPVKGVTFLSVLPGVCSVLMYWEWHPVQAIKKETLLLAYYGSVTYAFQ